jgi:hypothetical protein
MVSLHEFPLALNNGISFDIVLSACRFSMSQRCRIIWDCLCGGQSATSCQTLCDMKMLRILEVYREVVTYHLQNPSRSKQKLDEEN